jgi:predicted AAA+ superfamily ATPase
MLRYLTDYIRNDLAKKMVFVAGPRQVGKTTVAMSLLGQSLESYLNWDVPEGRERILRRDYPASPLVVFDELHKFKSWKNFLKGLSDDPRRAFQIRPCPSHS